MQGVPAESHIRPKQAGGKGYLGAGLIPRAPWSRLGRMPDTGHSIVTRRPEFSMREAKFPIGAVVKHRIYPFRGVVFDVDPEFNNTEEWWESIPEEVRPRKDQPFYHLLAENEETTYIAYVSEQNLLQDETGQPCRHPQIGDLFEGPEDGRYLPKHVQPN
jgi:heat shock protein HspQ